MQNFKNEYQNQIKITSRNYCTTQFITCLKIYYFQILENYFLLQNINTSQESSTEKYSYLTTPSSVEIITNDLEQNWANDDLITIKKGDYIAWLSKYPNDYSIGKVVKFHK